MPKQFHDIPPVEILERRLNQIEQGIQGCRERIQKQQDEIKRLEGQREAYEDALRILRRQENV
jgi:chromosome segregation ATPase